MTIWVISCYSQFYIDFLIIKISLCLQITKHFDKLFPKVLESCVTIAKVHKQVFQI